MKKHNRIICILLVLMMTFTLVGWSGPLSFYDANGILTDRDDEDDDEEDDETDSSIKDVDFTRLPEWQKIYNDFLVNKDYLKCENSEVYSKDKIISYSLLDMEQDGIPELFIFNGEDRCYMYAYDSYGGFRYLGLTGALLYYYPGSKNLLYNMNLVDGEIDEDHPVASVFGLNDGSIDGAGGETVFPDIDSMLQVEFLDDELFELWGWRYFVNCYKDSERWNMPDFENLEQLLYQFDFCFYGDSFYCDSPDTEIVKSVIYHPTMAYIYDNLDCSTVWSDEEGADPRGYIDDWGAYFYISKDSINWMLTNIYNINENECASLIEDELNNPSYGEDSIYEDGKYIYSQAGGVGGPASILEYHSIDVEDNAFVIVYRDIIDDSWIGEWRMIKVEYKEIEEKYYWTILSYDTNIFVLDNNLEIAKEKELENNKIEILNDCTFDNDREIDLRWGWNLFNRNASAYNHDLAVAGLALSQSLGNDKQKDEYLYDKLKFENISVSDATVSKPKTIFGAKKVTINLEEKIIISATIRGTTEINDYRTLVNDVHGGFDTTAKNVMDELDSYIRSVKSYYSVELNKDNTIFYITGHSLGGAVSGLLGHKIYRRGLARMEDIFVYTYASPQYYTTGGDPERYTNIHNIINVRDSIPSVVYVLGGLYSERYGHDWYYDADLFTDQLQDFYVGWGDFWARKNPFYHHITSTYLALMVSDIPSNLPDDVENNYSLSCVRCPVDVTVLDMDDNVLAYTEGEEVFNDYESPVMILTDGEEKYIISDTEAEYKLLFVGTDEGSMTYSQSVIDGISGEVIEEICFENVKIEDGKTFTAEVEDTGDVSGIQLFYTSDDGEVLAEIGEDGKEVNRTLKNYSGNLLFIVVALILFIVLVLVIMIIVIVVRNRGKKENNAQITDQPMKVGKPRPVGQSRQVEQLRPVDRSMVQSSKFCAYCGAKLESDARFCTVCGNATNA